VAVSLCSLIACTSSDDAGDRSGAVPGNVSGDCVVVDIAVSSDKLELIGDLAADFNASGAEVAGRCVDVRPFNKTSGATAEALVNGWDETSDGPPPVLWSPATSLWGATVNHELAQRAAEPIVTEGEPFMISPHVVAMPEPMARALGWPDVAIGWADLFRLARSPEGWAAFGHPEWGAFKLGKTNPNFSTSGLNTLIAMAYAATGKTAGLTTEDLARPEVIDFAATVESAVVHYGDTARTFLTNWHRADQRGTALSYVSAVAVEEKAVIDYNTGDPDGELEPGEELRPPRTPLVAIYPSEGVLISDHPLFVVDAEWTSRDQAEAAELFVEFVRRPEAQMRVLDSGFRPGLPDIAYDDPISEANGVDPTQPAVLLEPPHPEVTIGLLELWNQQRKRARVLLLVDVSGSMGNPAAGNEAVTRLDLAKEAAIDALELLTAEDEVALRIFSTRIDGPESDIYLDLADYGALGTQGEQLRATIRDLIPLHGTPLYAATLAAYQHAVAHYDPTRINAVVVLSDGRNEDANATDDERQLEDLLVALEAGNEGAATHPVRVFTIAYSDNADANVLDQIATTSTAAAYDATDPTSIDQVLTAVISNF
jgi:Ca-activated chloride channel family protein